MTTLEIKRLDTTSDSSSPVKTSASPTPNAFTRYSLQQAPASHNTNKTRPLSTSPHPDEPEPKQPSHEIPINIIKSPSYTHQLSSHSKSNPKLSTPSPNTTNSLNTTKNDNSYSTSQSQLNYNDGDLNSTSNLNIDSLTFNKYGFVQPANSNSNLNASSNVNAASSSTLNKSGANLNNNNNSRSLERVNAENGKVVANLKDYLQNNDVEQFAEKLPIKVIQLRELKWVEMLSSFDEWMGKRFKKVKSRCRKGIPQSMRAKAW